MNKKFGLALAAGLFSVQFAFAQNQTDFFSTPAPEKVASTSVSQPDRNINFPASKSELIVSEKDKESRRKALETQPASNVYNSSSAPRSEFGQPISSNTGSFTVRKFEESKVAKKLRRGEARSRFSVPDPKGKPLVHRKKSKFHLFG